MLKTKYNHEIESIRSFRRTFELGSIWLPHITTNKRNKKKKNGKIPIWKSFTGHECILTEIICIRSSHNFHKRFFFASVRSVRPHHEKLLILQNKRKQIIPTTASLHNVYFEMMNFMSLNQWVCIKRIIYFASFFFSISSFALSCPTLNQWSFDVRRRREIKKKKKYRCYH